MSLIKCSECGKEISNKAISCPNCGNPIVSNTIPTTTDRKVEIEMTNKKWKKRFVVGMLVFVFGWITMAKSIPLGFFIMLIAFCIVISARIGAWWTNG